MNPTTNHTAIKALSLAMLCQITKSYIGQNTLLLFSKTSQKRLNCVIPILDTLILLQNITSTKAPDYSCLPETTKICTLSCYFVFRTLPHQTVIPAARNPKQLSHFSSQNRFKLIKDMSSLHVVPLTGRLQPPRSSKTTSSIIFRNPDDSETN